MDLPFPQAPHNIPIGPIKIAPQHPFPALKSFPLVETSLIIVQLSLLHFKHFIIFSLVLIIISYTHYIIYIIDCQPFLVPNYMTPKLWQENKATIKNYIAKENQKLSNLRGEISIAENILKRVELMEVEQNVKTKNRQTEI